MISTQWWTTKFATRFCATGSQMVYHKCRPTAECPHCSYPLEDTTHILQCPQQESQHLWDAAILELWDHLLQADTDPDLIKDLSTGLDAWRKQSPPPPAITNAGRKQLDLTWANLVHGFLSTQWKLQQASYLNSNRNSASPAMWAADLLWKILKIVCQQWDHCNKVLQTTTKLGQRPSGGQRYTATILQRKRDIAPGIKSTLEQAHCGYPTAPSQ